MYVACIKDNDCKCGSYCFGSYRIKWAFVCADGGFEQIGNGLAKTGADPLQSAAYGSWKKRTERKVFLRRMGFLRHECKITVIDKKCFTDYQEQCLADPKSGPCPFFNVGDTFLLKRTPQQDDFYPLMLVNRAICGFLGSNSAILRSSAVQRYIPERLRSRVNALSSVLLTTGASVFSLLMGFL